MSIRHPQLRREQSLQFFLGYIYIWTKPEHYLGEDDEGTKSRGDLPHKASIGGEPLDITLVAAVEEDRPHSSAGPATARPVATSAHQVPLIECREVREAEMIQRLREIPGLVLVRRLDSATLACKLPSESGA